ncbi:fatty acid 2-hydroxylase [Arapaima gigas]
MSPSVSPRFFSPAEVARHRTKESCWVLLGERVYDVTGFLRMHPGGEALILRRSGTDIGAQLEGPPHRHSENARRWMEHYYIGQLDTDGDGGQETQVGAVQLYPDRLIFSSDRMKVPDAASVHHVERWHLQAAPS